MKRRPFLIVSFSNFLIGENLADSYLLSPILSALHLNLEGVSMHF